MSRSSISTDEFDCLKPYEDDQPKLSMRDKSISRMPSFISADGTAVNPEFQLFFSRVARAVSTENVDLLFNMSSGNIDFGIFQQRYMSQIGDNVQHIQENSGKLDIELNLARMEEGTRNILGGFVINGWYIQTQSCEDLSINRSTLIKVSGELLFTYNGEFQIVQHIPETTIETE